VIIGAAREAADAIGHAGATGDDDHVRLGVDACAEAVGRRHAVEQLESAAARLEHQVDQHQRRPPDLDRPEPFTYARRGRHIEGIGCKVVGQKPARRLVVLDNQDQTLLVHIQRSHERESRPGQMFPGRR
jgi:hypothetical protein